MGISTPACIDEIGILDDLMGPLVQEINPRLTEFPGIGTENAVQLLVTAGGQPRPSY